MTANLMEAVSGLVTPDLVQKAASATGESPEGTRSALLGAVPTLFAGLAHTASSPAGAASVFGLVTRAATRPKEIGGPSLLSGIFGGHADSVTDAVAGSAGIRRNSASGILALIGPLALGALGKEVMSKGLSAGGLAETLFGHKKAILDNPDVPKGLAPALGLGNLGELGGTAAAVGGPTVSAVERPVVERPREPQPRVREQDVALHPRRPSRWPIMLLPALLLGVIALWGLSNMFKGHPNPEEVNGNPTMRQGPGVREPQGPPPAEPTKDLSAPQQEPESPGAMTTPEIAHPESALPESKINFETATARLTPGSTGSVDALVSYMEANPTARIHVEGFADSTGQAATNEALSVSRAEALKTALVAHGVDESRIETSGMGQEHPVAPNDSAQDRAENRRVEVTLVH
jgi:outer membrane protein OmpA-like peptidoglycan-associated protein